MKKSDLKDWMICVTRDDICWVVKEGYGLISFSNNNVYDSDYLQEDLSYRGTDRDLDIVKVYARSNKGSHFFEGHMAGELLWRRDNEVQQKIQDIRKKQEQLASELKELESRA